LNQVVIVNVSVSNAPAPSKFQSIGAIISQGATTLTAPIAGLITQNSDLTAILKGALPISTLAWSSSLVTATTTAPHGIATGQSLLLTIAGAIPTGYNGTFQCTSTGASTFTYPLASNPGTETTPGVYTPEDVAELVSQVTTWFAQGQNLSVYVLELGESGTAAGVTALNTYINNNTVNGLGPFYSYLVPLEWSGEPTFFTFLAQFESLSGLTYFFCTATGSNYTSYVIQMKDAFVLIEAPAAPATEFSAAAMFFKWLNAAPSSTNKVTTMNYSNLFGVTPYPQQGNGALLTTYFNAFINIVQTGAEGQLTNTILRNGTTRDGNDGKYWYSVDWVQLNININLSAAVFTQSQNAQNPLQYNQDGINRLAVALVSTMNTGVNFGLVLGVPTLVDMAPAAFVAAVAAGQFAGQTAVNAFDFLNYSLANPNDYANGLYSGFQVAYTPSRGFNQIIVGVNISNFVST
jgi:hypothetical protein